MNSNQQILEVGGKEYILTLNRKGIEAIEKYTNLSQKRKMLEDVNKKAKEAYIEEIPLDEDPFANLDETQSEMEETMELLKRTLWICLWENHHMNIEEVRELLVQIIDEDKVEDLNDILVKLTDGVNKAPADYLKNTRALTAKK